MHLIGTIVRVLMLHVIKAVDDARIPKFDALRRLEVYVSGAYDFF